ncbi:MAG TPA: zf-HC2 domain-containing protein [Candidatus Acidoferrum sp.]|nr:zf-HC2 domain-containing protein [Candidatus Acidoferrum sp.]
MKCDFADSLLQGYFDGELSSRRAAEFERHLQHCDFCATELVDLDWLSGALRLTRLYVPAPASLRRKIDAEVLPKAPAAAPSKPRLWHWAAAAAALLFLAIGLWKVSLGLRSDDYQTELAGEIVEAHLRSLQPGPMAGIASNDERIIKGWFDANLKFAFPVRNFTEAGFALNGGRLDVVEGRSVAVLAYEHNGHPINVFIWPTRERDTSPREGSRQGFQWVDWRKDRLEFCAVSGAAPADLEQLNRLMSD